MCFIYALSKHLYCMHLCVSLTGLVFPKNYVAVYVRINNTAFD